MNDLSDKLVNDPLKSQNLAIFCGAGISYNSGIPLANDLVFEVLTALGLNALEATTILESNLPFEYFVQTLMDEVNIDHILDVFEKGEPNTNHRLIAGLAKKGYVKNILTTNFDLLLEKAFIDQDLKYKVFSNEDEFSEIDWENGQINIIKIHGCISNRKDLAITLEQVASQTITAKRSRILSDFFTKQNNPTIMILGYSCSDIFDISPQLENLDNSTTSEILFIQHCNSEELTFEKISIEKFKNPFQAYNGKRIFIDTNKLIKDIWQASLTDPYKLEHSEFNWKGHIELWLESAISEVYIGIKNHIAARLFYDISDFENAVRQNEKAIAIAHKLGDMTAYYSALGNLGMAFNAWGRFTEAKSCLQESVKACHDIGNIQGEVSQLQALGNVCRNLGEYDEAEQFYLSTIDLLDKYDDLNSRCTCLGNLATVYTQTNRPEQAIKHLEQGIKLARHLGNKQSESSMLSSLGISFGQLGDSQKGKFYIEESLEITRLIGDKRSECMALFNLSSINLKLEDFNSCLSNAKESLRLAQSFDIRQSEANAFLNVGLASYYLNDLTSAMNNLQCAVNVFTQIFGIDHPHTQTAIKAYNQVNSLSNSM